MNKGSQGRNSKRKPGGSKPGDSDYGGALLTGLFPMACSATFAKHSRGGPTHIGLAPPTSIIRQENSLHISLLAVD